MTDTTTGAVEAIAQKITKPPISMCWFGDDAELLVGIMRALAAERDALAAQLAEVAQVLAWQCFGECRGFSENLLSPHVALENTRATLSRITKETP